jgi:tetratricopeptide (TPR) repeat protein
MGAVSGEPLGYDIAPAAILGNAETRPRKHTNHMVAGPDYSIVHRGIFPHHRTAIREEWETREEGLATMREWITFDDAGGWGTDEFEASIPEGAGFPAPWDDPALRKQARGILEEQYDLLSEYTRRSVDVNAPDAMAARIISDRIWAYWTNPTDPPLAVRMHDVLVARQSGDFVGAIALTSRLIADYPDYAEGWNQRATLYYIIGNLEASIDDCARVLELEPRHFGALSGRALIHLQLGQRALALKDMAAALALHPFLSERQLFPELQRDVTRI